MAPNYDAIKHIWPARISFITRDLNHNHGQVRATSLLLPPDRRLFKTRHIGGKIHSLDSHFIFLTNVWFHCQTAA